jgi:hypothetical protein
MKAPDSLKKQLGKLLLISMLGAVTASNAAEAAEDPDVKQFKSVKVLQFSDKLKIRGFEIADSVYMGQAKVAGKYGFGFVVDRKSYAWGISNRGVSIHKSF